MNPIRDDMTNTSLSEVNCGFPLVPSGALIWFKTEEKWKVKLAQNLHPGFETDFLLMVWADMDRGRVNARYKVYMNGLSD